MALAVVGGVLGLLLAYPAIGVHFGFDAGQIPRLENVHMGLAALGLGVGLSVISGLLVGLVAFMNSRRSDVRAALVGGLGRMTAGRNEQAGRRILVGIQIALALTLLVGSALMARSFWELHQVDLGFDAESTLTFSVPVPFAVYGDYRSSVGLHARILDRLRALPGVRAAELAEAVGFPLFPTNYPGLPYAAVGRTTAEPKNVFASHGFATPGYFEMMGIPVMRGRTFRAGDWDREAPAVILSRPLADQLFGSRNPIGRRVSGLRGRQFTVIGVVGGVPSEAIRNGPSKMLYHPQIYPVRAPNIFPEKLRYIPVDVVYAVGTSVSPLSIVRAVRRIVHEADPKLLVTDIATMSERVAQSMARTRLMMILLFAGAVTAGILAVIGLYGLLSYAIRQRVPELGICMALGASPGRIIRMVVGQGVVISLIGIAVGIGAAWVLTRFLVSLLYEVSPTDPLILGAAGALLFAVAILASYIPAHRAGRIDPARALNAE